MNPVAGTCGEPKVKKHPHGRGPFPWSGSGVGKSWLRHVTVLVILLLLNLLLGTPPVHAEPSGPLTVTITRPIDGATFTAPAAPIVTATATTEPGTAITRVELYHGTKLVTISTSSTLNYTFEPYISESYTLTAKATDSAGRVATSSPVTFNILPPPWQSGDIGSVGMPGSAAFAGGTHTVKGSGADIWGTADEFRYVYQTLTGDGQITARVASLQNTTHEYAKAGVMIRETLAADSANAMMEIKPGYSTAIFQRRLAAGAPSIYTSGPYVEAPHWVRLVRSGNTISGYASADGVNWVLVGSDTLTMASTVYIGLAVTSHDNTALSTALFDHVSLAYAVTELGTLGGNKSSAVALNDAGIVVGQSDTATGENHAFFWKDGVMTDMGAFDVVAVNEAGQVIGTRGGRSYFWEKGALSDLGTLGGPTATARAINDSGAVVGESETETGLIHAFLWTKGVMTDLETLDGDTASGAYDINNSGQVVGTSTTYSNTLYGHRSFLWANGLMTDLGRVPHQSLPYPYWTSVFINERGDVAGCGKWPFPYHERTYVLRGGQWVDTHSDTISGRGNCLTAFNNLGQVGGNYTDVTNTYPFLWDNGTTTYLGTIAPNTVGAVTGMNNAGEIIGALSLGYGGHVDPTSIRQQPWISLTSRAFIWKEGAISYLPSLFGGYYHAIDINASGQIAGTDGERAVLWTPQRPQQAAHVGVFREGEWFLDKNRSGTWESESDATASFGNPSDIPVTGNWTGASTQIGVFRSGAWYLDINGNGAWDDGIDAAYSFGIPTDIPVTGKWNGGSATKIGVFRNGAWHLDMNGNGGWDEGDASYSFGIPGDKPITGDWTGTGTTRIGVVRGNTWYLDMNGNGTWDDGIDAAYSFGNPDDVPVTGDWNGGGTTKIGVIRGGTWFLDMNGNGFWDEGADAVVTGFGIHGDVPVTGAW
ncbi:Ig-like domain-containing protein [Geobacter sp. DSM 9736]|uniref:Ig-like domain-containing protein n=1 Tax=Geobacter sp. DSM 9736 TaxID=1277350 RepID=UPI000B5E89D6|nr:Ig-like domain-containing protein [Geobacter sp. DSM 9736]SNB47976.1 probable extracellular repeat, HAF family [Geobacter sp. DSM 9736]